MAAFQAAVEISVAVALRETGDPMTSCGSKSQKHARLFFTEEEQKRIRDAITKAESGTSGEIATMIASQSDLYREAEVLGSVLVSGLVSVVLVIALHHVTIWTYIPLVFVCYFPLLLMFRRFPRLKIPFVNRKRLSDAVMHGAIRGFYEKGLHRTMHETGILIYISILERKVWILGDRGINEKIPKDFWARFAAELAGGLRENRACDALCSIVEGCGAELASHFPHSRDDINELPDHLIM